MILREDVTRNFMKAADKNLKVMYNISLSEFEVYYNNELVFNVYDDCDKDGNSTGKAKEAAQQFINEF